MSFLEHLRWRLKCILCLSWTFHIFDTGLWFAKTFLTSSLQPLKGIQENSTGSKISTYSTKFVFIRPIGKSRWPSWPLIGGDIFNISSTADINQRNLTGKQDLNVLYQVWVFRANKKTKMATLASDLLRHFQLLLCNCWTELHNIWQEARSQRSQLSLFFLCPRNGILGASNFCPVYLWFRGKKL